MLLKVARLISDHKVLVIGNKSLPLAAISNLEGIDRRKTLGLKNGEERYFRRDKKSIA
jgi:hypothetical protein